MELVSNILVRFDDDLFLLLLRILVVFDGIASPPAADVGLAAASSPASLLIIFASPPPPFVASVGEDDLPTLIISYIRPLAACRPKRDVGWPRSTMTQGSRMIK